MEEKAKQLLTAFHDSFDPTVKILGVEEFFSAEFGNGTPPLHGYADSVGLGKTFEALAIVKYYELRNDRVLILCPKRLRDNWTLYKANDRRNFLAADRFNYDVLNHTDLSRDGGIIR